MDYLELTLPEAASNLALDEALLLEAEAERSGEVLRIWEWPTPVVVLGAGSRLTEDVNVAACEHDRVPILRRSSGGGTVLLGEGCLLYSLVLRYDRDPTLDDIRASYGFILDLILDALDMPGTRREGSDLALDNLKFSGTAQQRKRTHLLHHGTLLHSFDVYRTYRYLRPPRRQPDYRAGRTHEEFLVNFPRTADDIKRRLSTAWEANRSLASWPEAAVRTLCAEKYERDEWNRRR